ncbi:protein-tyrosine phosphatase [Lachnospiraceae bacterium KHCPX20]|nr:protein-tyrosine phosphatase [Lachnospiraceae bacterium KHCPX20]
MIKILFICYGNICRSPMAEFILKDMVRKRSLTDQFHIESAATSTEEIWNGIGNPVYPPAREVLLAHGIDCEGKRARQITAHDYEAFDLLIAMDENNLRDMSRVWPEDPEGKIQKMLAYAGEDRDVADPWYTGDFSKTWDDIYRGCEGLLATIA